MTIVVNLDVMLAKRKVRLGELADGIGITMSNLSILKTGKAKAIRFSTLAAICALLNCRPFSGLYFIARVRKAVLSLHPALGQNLCLVLKSYEISLGDFLFRTTIHIVAFPACGKSGRSWYDRWSFSEQNKA